MVTVEGRQSWKEMSFLSCSSMKPYKKLIMCMLVNLHVSGQRTRIRNPVFLHRVLNLENGRKEQESPI